MKKTFLVLIVFILFIPLSYLLFADEITANLLYEKGLTEFNKKNYQAAETAFLKAIEAFPNHLKSYAKLGELCEIDETRHSEAVDYYSRAKELLEQKENLTADDKKLKSTIESRLKQLDKLSFQYNTERTNYIKVLLSIVTDAKKDKRYDLALKAYEELLIIDPKNAEALKGKKEMENLTEKKGEKKDTPDEKDKDTDKKDKDFDPAKFSDIFNGKDLRLWLTESDVWKVKDGEMCASASRTGVISYKEETLEDNFGMTLTFKLEALEGGIVFGFSDIMEPFYSLIKQDNAVVLNTYQPEKKGKVITGNKAQTLYVKRLAAVDEDEWNTLTMIMKDGELIVKMNDQKCFEYKIPELIKGRIGVMVVGGNIQVKSVKLNKQIKKGTQK